MSDDKQPPQDDSESATADDEFAAESEQLEDLFDQGEPDRNRNLSSVIDDIQDYGSGAEAVAATAEGTAEQPDAAAATVAAASAAAASVAASDETWSEQNADNTDQNPWDDEGSEDPQDTYDLPAGNRHSVSLLMIVMPLILLTALGASIWWVNGRITQLEQQSQHPLVNPLAAITEVLAEQLGELEARILAIESKASFRDTDTDLRLGKLEQLEDTVGAELRQLRRELMAVDEGRKRLPRTIPIEAAAADAGAADAGAADAGAADDAAAGTTSEGWFVNMGTFSQLPMAQTLAAELKVSAGSVEIVPGEVSGRTLYRVRVAGFTSRFQANRARYELQREYAMSGLWIGRVE